MNNNFLPSKSFFKKAIILIVLVIIVLLITKVTPSIKDKIQKTNTNKKLTVSELVGQDSNTNGIQDWEEVLWGLNPKGDGSENKNFINEKKKAAESGILNLDNTPLTKNDNLSRELLAMIVTLQQSGNLNEEALKNISESVGKNITAEKIPDVYTRNTLNVQGTTTITIGNYQDAIRKVANKYDDKDIGGEINFIGQAMLNNDPQILRIALSVSDSYRAFGKDLMKVTVPSSLVDLHIQLANNYEKTAQALENMRTILDDPMVGMTSIVQYKMYSDALIRNLADIKTFFMRNGILSDN